MNVLLKWNKVVYKKLSFYPLFQKFNRKKMRLAASHNVSGMRTNENAQQGESHCQATKLPTYIKKGHKANFEQSVCCSAKQFRQKHLTRHMKHHIQHKFNIVLIDSHATMPWTTVHQCLIFNQFADFCWSFVVTTDVPPFSTFITIKSKP